MKPIFLKTKLWSIAALIALTAILFSFTNKNAGGEGFEIYLNNKLVLQKFGGDVMKVSDIELNPNSSTDNLTVKYFHCGKAGKERNLVIKTDKEKTLRSWHYGDASAPNAAMLCKVKEISSLQKFSINNPLKLYYSSKELPAGRLLATVHFSGQTARK